MSAAAAAARAPPVLGSSAVACEISAARRAASHVSASDGAGHGSRRAEANAPTMPATRSAATAHGQRRGTAARSSADSSAVIDG